MAMRKRLARLISNILNPFLVSFAVIILLSFESTSGTPDALKWASISIALSVLPVFAVVVYLIRIRKLESIFVNPRRQRTKIYLLASVCAVVGCVVLHCLGAPELLVATFVAGLAAIVIFMGINLWWKISLHTAFIAGSVAILIIVYGAMGALTLLVFLPVVWARLELELHSPAQIASGALLSAAIVVVVFQLFGLIGAQI
jgi:hypothetical protein